MSDELSRKIITIKGLKIKEWEKNGTEYSKFELYAGEKNGEKKERFWFWTKKQDGGLRVATKQITDMGFPINKKVGAIFKVKPVSYTNKAGKEISYTDREIVKFESLASAEEKAEQQTGEEEEIEDEVSEANEIEDNVDQIHF